MRDRPRLLTSASDASKLSVGPIFEELRMKKLVAVATVALFALAPGIGSACEYGDSASSTAAEQLGLAPAATKVPAPTVAKAKVTTPAKQVTAKVKAPAPDAKVAAVSAN
jgi:hypothetical protein